MLGLLQFPPKWESKNKLKTEGKQLTDNLKSLFDTQFDEKDPGIANLKATDSNAISDTGKVSDLDLVG